MGLLMQNQRDRAYFNWLISQVEVNSPRSYINLFEKIHGTDFVWIIPNDDNRVYDGFDLRTEFVDGTHGWKLEDVMKLDVMTDKGASVFEVLIGLSRRIAFTAGGEAPWWAWQLLGNLGLHKFPDPLSRKKADALDEILEALIWRTYQRDGRGGFFPLNEPIEDQTKVEIWYQMNQYAMEIQEQ
jgi:hypothetical protein